MRIAVICPVGRLDRYGYQHVARQCIASHRQVGDTWLYPSTTRANVADPELGILSDSRTWFEVDPAGNERFDIMQLERAANVAYRVAQEQGYDAAIGLHVNNWVTGAAADWLYFEAARIVADKEFLGWTYRRDQLAELSFGCTVRRPRIINLHADPLPEVGPDTLTMGGEIVARMERGDWPEMDRTAIWDVQLEMTLQDLADKLNFQRCYSDLVPKRKAVFEWPYWRRYYLNKFSRKRRTTAIPPLPTRADFVSWELARAL